MITLHIPRPPSTNSLYDSIVSRSGRIRRVKTKAYKDWIKHAGWSIRAQRGIVPGHIGGPVEVSITVPKKDNRKEDLDNKAKAVLDLLASASMHVIDDDRHVEVLYMEWDRKTDRKDTTVKITGLSEQLERRVKASREVA